MLLQKQDVLQILSNHQEQFHNFGVKTLFLFGSVARNDTHTESDVDLLVEFDKPVSLLTFIGLKQYLEKILDCRVDLATFNSLKSHIKENVLKEALRVF